MTKYGKIDMVCLDMWLGKPAWEGTGETVKNAVREQSGKLTVVAEVKYHAEKPIDRLPGEAIQQIHERRYCNKYTGKVLLPGIAFSGKQPGCRMEILDLQ